tara:strand:- start:1600 stop:1959 length:360 start_codon:yes stop_codon:yes gene_type:complete
MSLSGKDAEFVAKRRQLISAWRYVGGLLSLAVAGLALYLWLRVPLLGNPIVTARRVEAGDIADTTLLLSVVMLPIIVIALLVVVASLIAVIYRAFAHEKRHIAIIEKLQRLERRRATDS